jgi:hypothetical protein
MPKKLRQPEEMHFSINSDAIEQAPDRTLRSFRYIVSSVNEEALQAWMDIWKEFKDGVTPAGVVLPAMQQGFQPSCGWGEFLEKFWLLKHYLDYTERICKDQGTPLA